MMAGNYMGDFVGFSYFSQKQTVQFENPAIQTYSRLRRIFWPEQNSPENLLAKVPVACTGAHGGRRFDFMKNHEILDLSIVLGSIFGWKSRYANV